MSNRYLTILEVSQKQAYIFASNKLRDNITNSAVIAWVMSPEYFAEKVGDEDVFSPERNLVYSGGGHTVLEFGTAQQAKEFTRRITRSIMTDYPGITVFAKTVEYDEARTPGDNLKQLTAALEAKKSVRSSVFHQGSFGVERIDTNTLKPVLADTVETGMPESEERIDKRLSPAGYHRVYKFGELGGTRNESNFIAVVHIDGNAMGKRVEKLYEANRQADWDSYKAKIRQFSETIDEDFKDSYMDMVNVVAENLKGGKLDELSLQDGKFPVRRIITAGDDICFVTEGRIGIECAVAFLRALGSRKNRVDGDGYAACAGVAIVHQKYPFYMAYELAEMLCSNAKRFAASLSRDGSGSEVSAIDWHLEFGELKDTLEEIRADYLAADGSRLELRPYLVSAPKEAAAREPIRQYRNFRKLADGLQNGDIGYARGKLKELREVFKRGQVETEHYLKFNKIEDIALKGYQDVYEPVRYDKIGTGTGLERKTCVRTQDGVMRSLLFDAIEISDTFIGFAEV